MLCFWHRGPALLLACGVVALIMALAAPAVAQPSLAHAVPGAVAPGATTEVVLHGAKLDGPLSVWTSFPARIEFEQGDPNQKDRTQVKCKVTLAAGVPVGIGGVVVATPDGASDVLLVMVDDLPSIAESGNNHAPQSPQEVSLPAAIDGLCDGTVFDYFRFAAKAGQRVSCEVLATRLGWDFDPLVRVLDASGHELLMADDDGSTGADPRFVFTAPADGQYTIELRDNRYKPGGRYRLRLGDFPLVSTPLPPAASIGAAAKIGFAGPRVDGIEPLRLLPLGQPFGEALPIGVRHEGGKSSGWGTLLATPLAVVAESPVSGKPDEPTSVTLPCVVTGVLAEPSQRDVFQFEAKKGTPIRFRAATRSIGSPAIVSLKVLNSSGGQIAESPVSDSVEPLLELIVAQDGQYRLAVEELVGRGGEDYTYAIEIQTGPHFTLAIKNDNNNRLKYSLPAGGGALAIDVQCQRFGYDGPIQLAVDSPASGWHLFNNVIPAKAKEVKMYVVPPPDLAPGEVVPLRIVGRGDFETDSVATMSTVTKLRAARPQTPYPPAWLDGTLFVSTVSPKPTFYRVIPDRQEVNFPRLVGQTQLTLKFQRLDGNFKDVPLTVLPLGVPAGLSVEVKRNGNGPEETYDLIVKGPKDAAEGQHTLRYFAYAEMAGRGQGVYSGDIALNVITPLAVALAPAGPIAPGDKQKVKVTLTRRGDDRQPVEVKFKLLPAGVTAPDTTTVPADQSEIEIELTAAADAAAVKFEQLVAVASSKYTGTDISVESPAATLEVKTP